MKNIQQKCIIIMFKNVEIQFYSIKIIVMTKTKKTKPLYTLGGH